MSPKILWQPSQAICQQANLTHYLNWLRESPAYKLDFADYHAAWAWSAENPALFWESIADYFRVIFHTPATATLQGTMPAAQWFSGATLNYAEHIFRQYADDRPAILYSRETGGVSTLSWADLRRQVSALAQWLKANGVGVGDRVVGYLPNIPEATVAFLATVSIGAIWSSASPDFGAASVLERFGQIAPKVMIAVNGYSYAGKSFDKMEVVRDLQANMPGLVSTVLIDYEAIVEEADRSGTVNWQSILDTPEVSLEFTPVPFAHPLWILYSSGTTGIPKAIVHGHGGMLLEHLKFGAFNNDVHPGERFLWFTTTGWMMWNYLNAMLLSGATIVLYDGSPGFPDMGRLWRLVAEYEVHHFGVSAAFILATMKSDFSPHHLDLSALRSIGSTGSPLPPEGFDWIYGHVKPDIWLASMSGGTDVCTAFVGGNPLLPVYEGEIQCRALGCAMSAFNDKGEAVMEEVGEMVVTQPMPCMPVSFWNDPDGSKYRSSYFEEFPGVWRHGDWLMITERQSLVIYGRSDATLNRQGIRIGTSEIYRSVEQLEEIADSLIINIEKENGDSWMPLFVMLKPGYSLTDALKQKIARQLRNDYSPRHVPDTVIQVPEIPYTISGKKLELPVKKLLMGKPLAQSVNLGSVRNPGAFDAFTGMVGK